MKQWYQRRVRGVLVMETTLLAVSPVDGRYSSKTKSLSAYFSEYALFHYRVQVEVEYFLHLTTVIPQLKSFDSRNVGPMRELYQKFDLEAAKEIKAEEAVTNHDVKAVEYYVKKQMDKMGLSEYREWVHFALTSQDINNTSIPLALKDCLDKEYRPALNRLMTSLNTMSQEWMGIPMLARTHGQPATPTRLGKELKVFHYRITKQLVLLDVIPHSAKFGGATGQFNAHVVALPQIDWLEVADTFVASRLGLEREQWTTQISNYDNLSALCDALSRINVILMDLCKDLWHYISLEYFKQKIVQGEVGSSAMPHKVNPIDFENAEGNLGLANSYFHHFSSKLPISRLQRDLTDSTVLRNLGIPFAHTLIAISSLQRGIGKLILNEKQILDDLAANFIVVSEAIQTVLRREGFDRPYEKVKELTRTGSHVTPEQFNSFVDELGGASQGLKEELKKISPTTFIGVVPSC
eukprot:TRINITY_DN1892_c0_g1_i12.p1 TRINITY_DN1892_c0_g1~~TRINITY_DN1892_c0_g1_i12.p1  ORF type:complete len:465 (+),score=98.09 TRINITY_DN1892_c0_g1_i12:490-1884(+)